MNPERRPKSRAMPTRNPVGSNGFTLVELMVALAMVAILSAVAVPSFNSMLLRSGVRSASSDFGTDLNVARAEAIRVGGRVSLCPRDTPTALACGTDWRNGWLVFREDGTAGIGVFGGADRLLREHGAIHPDLTLARTAGLGALTFTASGALQPNGGVSTARFELRAYGEKGRNLEVSVIGRLTTTVQP